MNTKSSSSGTYSNDRLSTSLAVLSFCIPVAGAIIYISNIGAKPQKAKSAGLAALWGVGIATVLIAIGIFTGEIH